MFFYDFSGISGSHGRTSRDMARMGSSTCELCLAQLTSHPCQAVSAEKSIQSRYPKGSGRLAHARISLGKSQDLRLCLDDGCEKNV
ncbi:hypothetical protein RRG08_002711 [Elysia crispata]|uniref:Uncharacterized protein n=1 Tax=Elysia crispata TaxID=231223 RepID=A0AAE0XUD8_9GAST|nr:hypothetical protein RRG08_002711 [Elysia crispata]